MESIHSESVSLLNNPDNQDDNKLDQDETLNVKIEWLRDRIGECLGVYDLENTNIMVEKYYDQIKCFLEDGIYQIDDIEKKIMFVHRTYYDKLIETTITVLEEVIPPPVIEVIEPVKDKKGKKKGGAKPKKDEGMDESPKGEL